MENELQGFRVFSREILDMPEPLQTEHRQPRGGIFVGGTLVSATTISYYLDGAPITGRLYVSPEGSPPPPPGAGIGYMTIGTTFIVG